MNGSLDPDDDLGGHISHFKITIDGAVYQGTFNSSNPVFSLSDGEVNYTKTKSGTGDFDYSVKHEAGAPIRVETKDDDGLWSDADLLKVPNYPE